MWICSRVGRRNSLASLRQLRIYGTRYNIEKIQKLCENFEKACWRSVRIAEEKAYMQKYNFLKHCLKVIDHYKQKGADSFQTFNQDRNSHKISDLILDMYNGNNAKECLEFATKILDKLESSGDQDSKVGSVEEGVANDSSTKDIDFRSVSSIDVQKIKNIVTTLSRRVETVEKQGAGREVMGYTKSELEQMIKL